MKQLKTINRIQKLLPNVSGIDTALLYGSFGRGEGSPNSDIDIQVLVDKTFISDELLKAIRNEFQNEIQFIQKVELRKKVVAYFKSQPKIEFAICNEITEIDRNYLGSEIINVAETILYEKQPRKYEIGAYLNQLVRDYNRTKSQATNILLIRDLIDKFIYEFESCSTMQRRSDGYQFYFFYNIALQIVIQLNYLSKGHTKFNFLPKNFIANVLKKDEQEPFYQLKGTLFLPEANNQKRKLLDFFYTSIRTLVDVTRYEEIKNSCEWIYNRDFFWNFRDINANNPNIKPNKIFRTATLTMFQNESKFSDLLTEKNIRTVIDLRADKEITEMSYSETSVNKFNYVRTPFDPWNQPEWFVKNHQQGTNEEIAYRFFGMACQDQIKTALETIIKEDQGAVAIHCFAGKDRTGIFISLLHLLVQTPLEIVYADFLASEVDVKLSNLNIVLDIIKEKGGIESYLMWCGMAEHQINQLKNKLLN